MKALKTLVLVLCALFPVISCSNGDDNKYWLEATNEASATIQSCQGKVTYSDVLGYYVIAPEEQSICGTYYVVKNKNENFLESYKDKNVMFSGTVQKAKLCRNEDNNSTGITSADYFFLELEEIE